MRSGTKKIVVSLLCLIVLIGGYCSYCLLRPLKLTLTENSVAHIPTKTAPSSLVWPGVGQSAVGILGSTYIETHQPQTQVPTASVAKLITALEVLKLKPLQLGTQGPLITLSPSDVAMYNSYVARGGSVVPVAAGETISEYQMLQAMLLPSANNMADSLADWAYGSLPAYSQTANTFVAQQGLSKTHVGIDASGFDPSTVSTTHDLVLLGELALQNPVISQIVAQPSATGIPLTTMIKNINYLLGTNGIIGVKTGNTDQAGGVFVSGSKVVINNKLVTIVTALAKAPTLVIATRGSLPLIQSSHSNFQTITLVKSGTIVGNYALPWGGTVLAVASTNLSVLAWNDSPVTVRVHLSPINTKTLAGSTVGTVTAAQLPVLNSRSASVLLEHTVPQPSLWWKLKHPVN